ncbi:cytochrome P450 302a1, mitochondrial-like [Chrysoperla carnea]|uniref:cytochrome P450 302a1, mitochondrial-like n=1 Tax=Chrysoperla carnea TaxID=189513 RepID=UPI001D060B3A|nr:cytochrome P450 302a1, mitochondrial-like [Chrysoperla carnea]
MKFGKLLQRNYGTNQIKSFDQIPGPKSLPIIGTLWQYLPGIGMYSFDRIHHNGMKKFQKYGPVVREEFVPGVNTVWLIKPTDYQEMFKVEGKYPMRRSHLALEKFRMDRKHIYNSAGLLPTNGPEWYRLRSAIQKKISRVQNIKKYISSTNDVVNEFCQHIVELNTNRIVQNCYLPEFSRLSLELTCLVVFDERLNGFTKTELKENSTSSKLLQAAFDTNSSILGTDNGPQLWKYFDTPLYKTIKHAQLFMESIAVKLVTKKLENLQQEDKDDHSILEQLLKSEQLDYKDVIGFACDMLLAGIDTMSYTLCFVFYHLAKNPNAQEKLYKEILELLPNKQTEVTAEIIENAKYTKSVLKESLRLNPVSIGIGRILNEDAIFSNYHVPKGTVVVTQNQITCRLEEYFQNPNEFLPERWLRNMKDYKSVHPYLLLPFGHGPRSCIARRLAEQNMLIVILKIIRSFKVTWNDKRNLDTKSVLINKPDGKINLLFHSRK